MSYNEDAVSDLINRKANGRKPNPAGSEDAPERYRGTEGRAAHVEKKRGELGQAFAEMEEAGLSRSEAISMISPKNGSRAPKIS